MARNTIAEVSEKTLRLQSYLEEFKDGDELTYDQIEKATKIKMDIDGKQKLRTALRRMKREYSSIHGIGVRLSCPDLVMPILSGRYSKIDRAVKRADKTHHNLQEKFFHQLSPQDQHQVLYAGLVFGAIRVAAANGKLIYKDGKNKAAKSEISIPIPKINFS